MIQVLSLVENLFKKNHLQDLLSSLNAVISTRLILTNSLNNRLKTDIEIEIVHHATYVWNDFEYTIQVKLDEKFPGLLAI